MRFRQHLADNPCRFPRIHEIIDNQDPFAVLRIGDGFENFEPALILMLVGRNAHGVDQADLEFPRDDRRRHQSPPGIPVKLVPRDGKRFLVLV